MLERVNLVEPDIVALIERTVRETMDPFGLRSVDVRAGEDHDGDAILYVEARYNLSSRPLELGITGKVASILRQRLRTAGERRFPHVWHRFHEKQTVTAPRRRAQA